MKWRFVLVLNSPSSCDSPTFSGRALNVPYRSEQWLVPVSIEAPIRPVNEEEIGHVSPSAFCEYDHEKETDPKYFREILENSLNPLFCTDYMGLL